MRIASLVPSATELLFALGVGDSVVAVTHECDFPNSAAALPQLTRTVIAPGLSTAEIDAAVRARTERGAALYELDEAQLLELAPDLIVTQAVCAVCAVSVDDVRAVAERMPSQPSVISLDPTTLGEVLGDIPRLAQAVEADAAGAILADDCAARIGRVEEAVEGERRPRVVALEWLDPVFIGGHWIPQMIDLVGGEDPLGLPGERSRTAEWEEVAAAAPEVVVGMPCGYDTERSARELLEHGERVRGLGAGTVAAVDASAYFSRPGPRLVDGIELLGALLHPDRVEAPPDGRLRTLDLDSPAPVA